MKKSDDWSALCIAPSGTILEAAKILQDTSTRIVLVVDEAGKLIGVVTDGDIRRGLLAGISTDQACERVVNRSYVTVRPDGQIDEVVRLAAGGEVGAIPIVSDRGKLEGVWVAHSVGEQLSNTAVIMAGGKGLRLRPMTSSTPKPLVPLGDKPMLHRLLESLHSQGFRNVAISINYLGEQIEQSVGDGSNWGLSVTYLREDIPLGTAGALGLLSTVPDSPILVINADVMTSARLRDIVGQHLKLGSAATVGMRVHDIEHPFGVLDLDGSRVLGMREKPFWREFVSAGVYVVAPRVLDLIPGVHHLDMPDLINGAIEAGLPVDGFPLHEPWLDVGTLNDFRAAQDLVRDYER